jgi:hypothetical protein
MIHPPVSSIHCNDTTADGTSSWVSNFIPKMPPRVDQPNCPACLGTWTYTYPGNEFGGCNSCKTIYALDRTTTAQYDSEYVSSRYDKYPTTHKMSALREEVLYTVLRLHEILPSGIALLNTGPLLDVGYGNGDFIRHCSTKGWTVFGNDVNPTEYKGVTRVELPNQRFWPRRYRVVTFFDALEHFENLEEARWVSHHTDWILVSFPQVPSDFPYQKDKWKHYRKGEHHLYFQPKSMEHIFTHDGVKAEIAYCGNPEDSIRGTLPDGKPNICTVALRCFKEKN